MKWSLALFTAIAVCSAASVHAVKAVGAYAVAKEWNEHGKWECAAKIDTLRIGMSRKEATAVVACKPNHPKMPMVQVNTDETAGSVHEQWVLHYGDPDDPINTFAYLYFDNGTLTAIQKRR